jgi:hypothetical protein
MTGTPVPGAVHHVGFVVRSIAPTEAVFSALGYQRVGDCVKDDRQKAEILFLARSGRQAAEPLIELIAPLSEESRSRHSSARAGFVFITSVSLSKTSAPRWNPYGPAG